MVEALHAAGLEVILDVVYNRTAEGNHLGPTLSFRDVDIAAYFRLADDRRFYDRTEMRARRSRFADRGRRVAQLCRGQRRICGRPAT